MTDAQQQKYASVEEFLKAQSKLLNKQAFRGFVLVVIFIILFSKWIFTSEVKWMMATVFFGPIALSVFLAAMKRSEDFGKLQKKMAEEVVAHRVHLCVLLGNVAPSAATHMRFLPREQQPVQRYVPLQWWADDRAILAVDNEVFKDVEVYRETLTPWEDGDFQGSPLISLDRVFHDLFALEELGQSLERCCKESSPVIPCAHGDVSGA